MDVFSVEDRFWDDLQGIFNPQKIELKMRI